MRTLGRPWWQATRTVSQAYLLAGILLFTGVCGLAGFIGGDSWVELGIGLWCIILAAACLTSGVMLRRRASVAGSEPLTIPLDPAGQAEIESLLARGKFIPAVRRVRKLTGLDLRDAKILVNSLQR